jgi:hypothetical protein
MLLRTVFNVLPIHDFLLSPNPIKGMDTLRFGMNPMPLEATLSWVLSNALLSAMLSCKRRHSDRFSLSLSHLGPRLWMRGGANHSPTHPQDLLLSTTGTLSSDRKCYSPRQAPSPSSASFVTDLDMTSFSDHVRLSTNVTTCIRDLRGLNLFTATCFQL